MMIQKTTSYRYIVIGSGIAGLLAAYRLKKLGYDFLLLEKTDRIGGAIDTRHFESTIYEFGPNSFLSNSKPIIELVQELGLEMIAKDFATTKRYIYRQELINLPISPVKFLFSSIISIKAKFKLLVALFSCHKVFQAEDLAVYDFISQKFGIEIAEIFHTALKGIWAGDSRKLSAQATLKKIISLEQNYDSLFAALLVRSKNKKHKLQTLSFATGMQALVDKLVDNIGRENIILEAAAEILGYSKQKIKLKLKNNDEIEADNLIITAPAFAAAEMLQFVAPELSGHLASIHYEPINLFALIIDKKLFKSQSVFDAFGYLPVGDNLFTLGTIFSSELFDERKLPDQYLFTCFAKSNDAHEIIKEQILILDPYAKRKLQLNDFLILDTKHIDRAIPQYHLNHQLKVAKIEEELRQLPNLQLCGNYLYGVSLSDTIDLSLNRP